MKKYFPDTFNEGRYVNENGLDVTNELYLEIAIDVIPDMNAKELDELVPLVRQITELVQRSLKIQCKPIDVLASGLKQPRLTIGRQGRL